MTLYFAVNAAVLVAGFAAACLALAHFRRTTIVLCTLMLAVFPLMADSSDWNSWFDWAKRYTLLISGFLWAVFQAFPENAWAKRFVRIMPFVLMLNVLEAAALDLPGPSPLNGVLMAAVAFCGPLRLDWDEGYRRYGFRDFFWQASYVLTLSRLYVYNPVFENSFVGVMAAIIIPSVFCSFQRDTFNWGTFRIFALYPLLLQDSLFPKLSDYVYPEFLHAAHRVAWQQLPSAKVWLAINAISVTLMVYYRFNKRQGELKIGSQLPAPVDFGVGP